MKSIEGIVRGPARSQVYISKRRLDSYRSEPLVSLQSKDKHPLPLEETLRDIDIDVKTVSQKELVINVSKHFSIRASVSIILQYILIATIAIGAAYSTDIGQWFVVSLAVYIFIMRLSSQLTYGIAIFILISIPIFHIIGQNGVADNMTVYVFELFILGALQSTIELALEKRQNQSKSDGIATDHIPPAAKKTAINP